MRSFRRTGMAAALVVMVAPTSQAQPVTAIVGATVIDGGGGPPLERAVILVRGGRIEAVGREGDLALPRGAEIRRLAGRFITPGFIDMHAHVAFGPIVAEPGKPGAYRMDYDDRASREMASTLLGFGITTARNPGAPTREGVGLRDDIRLGRIPGPRLFTAGEVIDATVWPGLTTAVATEAQVRAEVARQVGLGVDYVKLYASLGPKLIAAGVDEAHRQGVPAIAHLFGTTWTEAAQSGIDGIVHIVAGSPKLLPEHRRAEFMKRFRGTQFMLEWFDYVDFESAEFTEMVAALVANHVTVDPTLVVFEAMARGDDPAVTNHPDLRYAPTSLLENWRTDFTFDRGWKPDDYQIARRAWPRVLAMTKRLADAGVLITVGTDVPNPWVPPGASFHRELELFRDAGFTNAAIIRLATRDGAQALGVLSDVGTIASGKRADLVVLSANPLDDIRNTRRIEWVVQDGKWYTPKSLLPTR